jgi:hypothetical protein
VDLAIAQLDLLTQGNCLQSWSVLLQIHMDAQTPDQDQAFKPAEISPS